VPDDQFGLFAPLVVPHPVVEELRGIDPNTLTPLQALEILARLVSDAQAQA
jgi:hypothetical protein